ncbi:Elongin-A [Dipsacomyces acuminosporus]|nr:Elongin-A [Dipsacomyces acuminosporus]
MNKQLETQPRVPSLKQLCQRALMSKVGRIRKLGAVPQFLVADALAVCTPKQLETIEHLNPHIIEDNEPLWMEHCMRSFKELRELRESAEEGASPSARSWRSLFWDMKHQEEIRAQEITERVRSKVAEIERVKSSRKVRMTKMPVGSAASARGTTKAASLYARNLTPLDRARIETKVHMAKMKSPVERRLARATAVKPLAKPVASSQRHSSPNSCHGQQSPLPKPQGSAKTSQASPAESPAHSPPYQAASYSPPYVSSASSCSPTHSACSPPYVPDSGNTSQNEASPSSGFSIFEDIFGWSPPGANACQPDNLILPPTVTITDQTVYRKVPAQGPNRRKRLRRDSDDTPKQHNDAGDCKRSRGPRTATQAEATQTEPPAS